MSTLRLEEWVSRLGREDIPTFAHTAKRMAAISANVESSANDLAEVILHDSTMTARVLKLVNSAFYNPTGRKLDTVSYAIVVLGFEKVRNLALTVSMLESTLNNTMLSHVKREMACAYHAAIQAQRLAKVRRISDTENIYIAALLHRLGQLMFWCFPYEHKDQLEKISNTPDAYDTVERDILGFGLRQLTDSLITEWNLSPLLHDALTNKVERDEKKCCIQHGFSIADCAKYSWENANANRQIRAISAFTERPFDHTRQWLLDNAKFAKQGLSEMGLDHQPSFITLPPSTTQKASKQNVIGIFDRSQQQIESKPELQRRLLRQLTHLLNEELDLNHFLFSMLEGINKATSCDQSFILLFKGKEREFLLKQHLGNESKKLANNAIKMLEDSSSALSQGLSNSEPCWSHSNVWLNAIDETKLPNKNLMIAPIFGLGKHLGYVFTLKTLGEALKQHDFECFRHFSDHASIAFRIFIRDKKQL